MREAFAQPCRQGSRKLSFGRVSACPGQVPPCSLLRRLLESCWRNKPSEVSFDSRRGATLETFSCRSGHSGLGASAEAARRPERAKRARSKALCGLSLPPTILPALAIATASAE